MIQELTRSAPKLQHFYFAPIWSAPPDDMHHISSETNYYGVICQDFQGLIVIGPDGEPQATWLVDIISCSKAIW